MFELVAGPPVAIASLAGAHVLVFLTIRGLAVGVAGALESTSLGVGFGAMALVHGAGFDVPNAIIVGLLAADLVQLIGWLIPRDPSRSRNN
jgi:hypothetical protein